MATPYTMAQLTVFLAVARNLSFSRAAAELHLSQPAASKAIQELERGLGQPLFHRQGRRIILSDAGALVRDHAQRLLEVGEEMERALAELSGLARGRLQLGASEVAANHLLPPHLIRFAHLYPGIQVFLHGGPSQAIATALGRHELDLALLEEAALPPQFQWDPLWSDELCLVVAPGHPLASPPRAVRMSDLLTKRWLLPEAGSGPRLVFEAEMRRLGYHPGAVLESGATPALVEAAVAGLGVGVVSRRGAAAALDAGRLVTLSCPELDLGYRLGLATVKGRRLSPAALALMASLRGASGT